ncbi:MAG: hypothetical protein ACX930_01415 [Erythrobacter sp.]
MQAMTIKQKRTNRFLRASEIGFVTFIFLTVVGEFADPATIPVWVRILAVAAFVACLASLALMFAYRNTDEYTRSLWNAGTSAS